MVEGKVFHCAEGGRVIDLFNPPTVEVKNARLVKLGISLQGSLDYREVEKRIIADKIRRANNKRFERARKRNQLLKELSCKQASAKSA